MKVKIGKYPQWIGPYQIAEKLMFWANKYENDNVHKFGEFLAHGFHKEKVKSKWYLENDDRPETLLYKFCSWIHSFKKRKIKIHIDGYDVWNMDNTLSMIVVPMLEKLKSNKQGSPFTDDEDVPEELKSTSAPPKEHEYDTDDNHQARWEWILDEIIWAHKEHINDDEPDFWIEKSEGMHFERCEDNPKISKLKYDKEGKFDHEAYKAYHDRKQNGFRLFGKYYTALWD